MHRGRASERATGDRWPRRCRSFVLVEEENRRSPAGREPIEKGRKCTEHAGASAAARFRWHRSRLFTPPTPLPARQVWSRAFCLFLYPPRPPSPILPSFSLHELACAARREAGLRGDFRSGESVDVESAGK